MKVAYVVSGMKLTFVAAEMEAHEKAGWQVLPLASCKCGSLEGLSEVVTKWAGRAIYRSNIVAQLRASLREFVTHPLRFLRICFWTAGLPLRKQGLSEFAKAVYELPTACDFAVHLRRFGAQHIHVHFASRSLSLGLMLGMLTALPVSCTVHAFDIFTRRRGSLRPRLSRCKFIAAVSQFNVDYLRRLCGSEVADLCHVVHCGIDLESFMAISRQPQAGHIVSVAKLVPKKGLDLAIQACAKLKEMNVEFLFEIVGDGPEKKHLKQEIQQLGLDRQVILLGSQPNDRLVPLLSRACVFLLPCVQVPGGDMDGIPVAMMEAMACEVPVVSRQISGIPELVHHNVNGLLVREQVPAAIAEAVKELLVDPDKARRFGRLAREQIQQNFNIVETSAQLRELIAIDKQERPQYTHNGPKEDKG
jgi:glycosyltransferase involved in cell wall biosynthesis